MSDAFLYAQTLAQKVLGDDVGNLNFWGMRMFRTPVQNAVHVRQIDRQCCQNDRLATVRPGYSVA